MTHSAADLERAARALTLAQGFSSPDAAVLIGLRSFPVWQTRMHQVRAVVDALASVDERLRSRPLAGSACEAGASAVGSEADETPHPFPSTQDSPHA